MEMNSVATQKTAHIDCPHDFLRRGRIENLDVPSNGGSDLSRDPPVRSGRISCGNVATN